MKKSFKEKHPSVGKIFRPKKDVGEWKALGLVYFRPSTKNTAAHLAVHVKAPISVLPDDWLLIYPRCREEEFLVARRGAVYNGSQPLPELPEFRARPKSINPGGGLTDIQTLVQNAPKLDVEPEEDQVLFVPQKSEPRCPYCGTELWRFGDEAHDQAECAERKRRDKVLIDADNEGLAWY